MAGGPPTKNIQLARQLALAADNGIVAQPLHLDFNDKFEVRKARTVNVTVTPNLRA